MDIQKKPIQKKVAPELAVLEAPREDAFFLFAEQENQRTSLIVPRGPHTFAEETLKASDFEYFQDEELPVPPAPPIVKKNTSFRWRPPTRSFSKVTSLFGHKRLGISLLAVVVLLALYAFLIYEHVETSARQGVEEALLGAGALQKQDFVLAKSSFQKADQYFSNAQRQTLYFPAFVARPLANFPGLSRSMAGVLALDAGRHLVSAGVESVDILETLVTSRETTGKGQSISFLSLMEATEKPAVNVQKNLVDANRSLQAIQSDVLPEEDRLAVELLQQGVPGLTGALSTFLETRRLFNELLGKNGPRTYLFLFQNNQELRPTGGFIGTYGILEFKDGHARRFFIDGIFNPDGQLKENIVPPKPIQKISAGWSLHDSNWFPHFPLSAEKAIFFYEKTGGPTVDGVFTLTPSVMERLLVLTGPIELPEYNLVVDGNNFIPTIQEQVEINYDRTENKPKKVLSDLASILMERVFSATDPVLLYGMANILVDGLNERQILLYTRNKEAEQIIEEAGWSGKQVASPHDYLSVVHTNINGYKTDGVIDETLEHKVTIGTDGLAVAEVTVTRVHTGGNTPYEWWNKVNSNYMRVYVPKGSELLSAKGHTREFPKEPLNYDALGFKRDRDVVAEEAAIKIDETSGTRVGEEAGKTVFGNWVYVSPGESVSVTYTYLLPFRVDPQTKGQAGYSLLLQKQPGVKEFNFKSIIEYPDGWKPIWQTGANLLPFEQSKVRFEQKAKTDLFYGLIFEE
jgi:hypothetical protein